jgi:hypothetical protein
MKKQPSPAAALWRSVLAAVFVAMSAVFVTVPYALSAHPGDPPRQVAAASIGSLA